MFTGIITGLGRITAADPLGSTAKHGKRLTIATPPGYLDEAVVGESIALNGACMTVASLDPAHDTFFVEVSAESLMRTAGLSESGPVNLERALRGLDRLGGHIVTGHVDGVGTVTSFSAVGESRELKVLAPTELGKYFACKGSVTVNGVSLTVNAVKDGLDGTEFCVNLIPHTLDSTALRTLNTGSRVNLEIDLIARYVERLLTGPK